MTGKSLMQTSVQYLDFLLVFIPHVLGKMQLISREPLSFFIDNCRRAAVAIGARWVLVNTQASFHDMKKKSV